MYLKTIFQRALPFGLAFLIAVFFVNIFADKISFEKRSSPTFSYNVDNYGTGSAVGCYGSNSSLDGPGDIAPTLASSTSGYNHDSKSLKIVSKPRPQYTDEARQNGVEGFVILRATFLANGEIGSITVVKHLGYGLDEEAIAAAKRIRFIPAISEGRNNSVTKQVEYSFSIY